MEAFKTLVLSNEDVRVQLASVGLINAFEAINQSINAFNECLEKAPLDLFSVCLSSKENFEEGTPWWRLEQMAKERDQLQGNQQAISALKKLQNSWLEQGPFSKVLTLDLLALHRQLDIITNNLVKLVNFEENIDGLNFNQHLAIQYRNNIIHALHWRVSAAIMENDLHYDDAFVCLKNQIKEKVFCNLYSDIYEKIGDLLYSYQPECSQGFNFEIFTSALQLLRKHYTKEKQPQKIAELLRKKIAHNNSSFPLTLHNDTLMPTSLVDAIPTSLLKSRGNFIRYWFFQGLRETDSIENTTILINETFEKIEYLETIYEKLEEDNYLNLGNKKNISTFLCAIELPAFIEREEARCHALMPTDFLGKILENIPLINRNDTYHFISQWLDTLKKAKEELNRRCSSLSVRVVNDFESFILEWILDKKPSSANVLVPSELTKLLNDIETFVVHYGSEETKLRLNRIVSPLNIISKANFVEIARENGHSFVINHENIDNFKVFSKKYWGFENHLAIKHLIDFMLRHVIPADIEAENSLFNNIALLLKSEDVQKEFDDFLKFIAKNIYQKMGDDGSLELLSFMERHCPECVEQFKLEREKEIKEKFNFVIDVLSCEIDQEFDLYSSEYRVVQKYVRDIFNHKELSDKQRDEIFIKAKAYVERYSGASLQYNELIRLLCDHTKKQSIYENYIAKHFSWLVECSSEEIKLNISKETRDVYTALNNCPPILSRIKDCVVANFIGNSADLNKIIDNLQDENLSIIYYSKRIEYLCENLYFAALVAELSSFDHLIQLHSFGVRCHEILGNLLKNIVFQNKAEYLDSDELVEIIERLGSVQNKESYRLLRIKRLLSNQDYEQTYYYINDTLAQFLQSETQKQLFMLPDTTELLSRVFKNHFEKELPDLQWSGHTQYLLELFAPADTQTLLYALRLQWLELFLFHPADFIDEVKLVNSTLDEIYHYQNLMVPNEKRSLNSYFFVSNINAICDLLHRRLDEFNPNIPEQVVTLLSRYIHDSAIRDDRHYSVLSGKLHNFQDALKIHHFLQSADLVQAVACLKQQHATIQSTQAEHPKDANTTIVHQHQKDIFDSLCNVFLDGYREKILLSQQGEEHSRQADFMFKTLCNKMLPKSFIDPLLAIEKDKDSWCKWYISFKQNLEFDNLHLLDLSSDYAVMAHQMLSKSSKLIIRDKILALISVLSEEDPIKSSLRSFTKVMYQSNLSEEQKDIIDFNNEIDRDYSQMAQMLQMQLQAAMQNNFGLAGFHFLADPSESQLHRFIHHLDNEHSIQLKLTLLDYIENLHLHFISSDLGEMHREWKAAGRLFHALDIYQDLKVKQCLDEAKSLFNKIWVDAHSSDKRLDTEAITPVSLPNLQNMLFEKQILKNILFAQTFGSEHARKHCSKIIDDVLNRSRQLLMQRLIGPFCYHSLDFANKLMLIAGNDSQKKQYRHLAYTWNCIQYYNRNSFAEHAEITPDAAVEQYVSTVSKKLFDYFTQKFSLSYDLAAYAESKRIEWGFDKMLIDPDNMARQRPVREFKDWLSCSINVNERDATELQVAFCVNTYVIQLGKMWLKKTKEQPELQSFFPLQQLHHSLNSLVERLRKQSNIGQGNFNQVLTSIVSQERDYFTKRIVNKPLVSNALPEEELNEKLTKAQTPQCRIA